MEDYTMYEQEIQKWKAMYADKVTELESATACLDKLDETIEALRDKKEKLDILYQEQLEENKRLRKQIDELRNDKEKLGILYQGQLEGNERLREQIDSRDHRIETLQKDITDASCVDTQKDGMIAQLREEKERLLAEIESRDHRIDVLRKVYRHYREGRDKAMAELDRTRQQVKDSDIEADRRQGRINKLLCENNRLQSENDKLTEEVELLRNQIDEVDDEYLELKRRYDDLLDSIHEESYEKLKDGIHHELCEADPHAIKEFILDVYERAFYGCENKKDGENDGRCAREDD